MAWLISQNPKGLDDTTSILLDLVQRRAQIWEGSSDTEQRGTPRGPKSRDNNSNQCSHVGELVEQCPEQEEKGPKQAMTNTT